jgi:hypothetical protein
MLLLKLLLSVAIIFAAATDAVSLQKLGSNGVARLEKREGPGVSFKARTSSSSSSSSKPLQLTDICSQVFLCNDGDWHDGSCYWLDVSFRLAWCISLLGTPWYKVSLRLHKDTQLISGY